MSFWLFVSGWLGGGPGVCRGAWRGFGQAGIMGLSGGLGGVLRGSGGQGRALPRGGFGSTCGWSCG